MVDSSVEYKTKTIRKKEVKILFNILIKLITKMNFKKRIAKWLRITEDDIKENDYYYPQKFGESRSVEYQLDGLVKTFCKVTEWSSGEGYDISIETNLNSDDNSAKKISIDLHIDEIQTLLYCLEELGYFETKP